MEQKTVELPAEKPLNFRLNSHEPWVSSMPSDYSAI